MTHNAAAIGSSALDAGREKDRLRVAEYRRRHPEKARASVQKYHTANREKILAQRRASYQKNKAVENARTRAYHAAHKEERNAVSLDYYYKHHEKLTALARRRARAAYDARVAQGLCGSCAAPLEEDRKQKRWTVCAACWKERKDFIISHLVKRGQIGASSPA